MANLRARQIVPRHFDWTDDDQYSDDGGVPCSAMLGRKLIRNDRALSAHCLRGMGCAFVRRNSYGSQLPVAKSVNGEIVGPWPFWGSTGAADGEVYIRASLAAGEVALVAPFVSFPLNIQPPAGPIDDADHTITGAAAGAEVNYGPFPLRVPEGMSIIGLAIYPTNDGADTQSGDIDIAGFRNRNTFRAVAGAGSADKIDEWVKAVPSTEFDHMIRFIDGNNQPLTTWKQIISVTTDIDTNDTVTFFPPVSDAIWIDDFTKGNIQWQSMLMVPVTIASVMIREVPPVDENYAEALSRG